jgi:hypothetical protein
VNQYTIGKDYIIGCQFVDETDGVTLIEVTNVNIKLYDSDSVQIGTTITTATKIGTGLYEYNLTMPNNSPYITIEWSGDAGAYTSLSRDILYTIWQEGDLSTSPMPTLTVGDNTYIDLEDANEYFTTVLGGESWFKQSESNRCKALIKATKVIDSLNLRGQKYDLYTQKLQFPRIYNIRPVQNHLLDNDSIVPDAVIYACCEEALSLLESLEDPTTDLRRDRQQQGVIECEYGDSREKYSGKVSSKKLLSDEAIDLLKGYTQHFITGGSW